MTNDRFDAVADLRLTFHQWNAIMPDHIQVLDPDGFDRSPGSLDFTTNTFTLEEWLERANGCTIQMHCRWYGDH